MRESKGVSAGTAQREGRKVKKENALQFGEALVVRQRSPNSTRALLADGHVCESLKTRKRGTSEIVRRREQAAWQPLGSLHQLDQAAVLFQATAKGGTASGAYSVF